MTMGINVEIPAGEFKAKCLKLMDTVSRKREAIVITKRGRPVAKLVPVDEPGKPKPLFGYMAGMAEIRGDIVHAAEPVWAASRGVEDRLYDGLAPADQHSLNRPKHRKRQPR